VLVGTRGTGKEVGDREDDDDYYDDYGDYDDDY
jgi:hypothetical protein